MDPRRQEFNWFVRRWQVQPFAAAFVLPMFWFVVCVFLMRQKKDGTCISAIMTNVGPWLTTLLIELWRVNS